MTNQYAKHSADALQPSSLESLCAFEHAFDDSAIARISERVEQEASLSMPRSTARRVTVALVAAAAVLVLAGFAFGNRFAYLWEAWFGDASGAAENAEDVGVSAQADGFELAIESVVVENGTTNVLVRITDLEQDRLAQGALLGHVSIWATGLEQSESFSALGSRLDYEAETRSLYQVYQIPDDLSGKRIVFSVSGMSGTPQSSQTEQTQLDLASAVRTHKATYVEKQLASCAGSMSVEAQASIGSSVSSITHLLKADETSFDLKGAPDLRITNVGYENGLLSVQMSVPRPDGFAGGSSGFYFVDGSGEQVSMYYGIRYQEKVGNEARWFYEAAVTVPEESIGKLRIVTTRFVSAFSSNGYWEMAFDAPA